MSVLRPATARGTRALRGSDTGLLVLALLVGLATGAGAVAFRGLITVLTQVFTGTADYAATPGAPHGWLGWGRWFVLLTPVVSGLLYGPLVHRFAREARGHGVPEVMVAVARHGGRIPAKVAAVKALASALTIGGGGSVGREGPIVQIGAALGSTLGTLVRVAEDRQRLLVACGAAGGIAATFNAPLAGVVFAMEIVLRDFAARSFGMVVVSAVTASVVGRSVLGSQAFLDLPDFTVPHLLTYALFAGLGVLAGLVGVGFTRVLYAVEDLCDRVWRGPEWLRPGAGGLLLGLLLLAVPQMYGVGYPVLGDAVAGRYAVGFLLLLLVAKAVATSLTIGIGGSGGVFAPSLFVGAALGAAVGQTAAAVAPGITGAPGAFALVGMAAVFAGAARAPITAVLIVFELTGEYSLILPLMAAVVLSTGISHRLSRDSIYTAKLRRRGVDLDAPPPSWAAGRTVASLDVPAATVLAATTPPQQAADALAGSAELPVADAAGYLGVVTARAVAEALAGPAVPASITDLVESRPTTTPAGTVDRALDLLDTHDVPGVAVVEDGRVVGWFTADAVLAALRPR
ncbi:chloride channel protein [Klenkia sp. PcliD-1-E]|uniref:chloride channel protein n=1 Tax=Klenkia sp. PcliD-1-E TaxID=2954492 RepID=UPI002097F679|nr:chloride channel protein [Klenkia sp. PcliD-1-E]MCO7220796.1 chloride channel protein [Klenkia sp. PcliD-1-E]